MRRGSRRLALLVFLLLGGGLTWGVLYVNRPKVTRASPSVRRLVRTVVSSGRVLPPRQIQLAALSTGNVVSVEAEAGDPVKSGQVLVRLDDAEATAAIAQAEAALDRAKAGAYELRRLSLPAAKEQLRRAEASLAQARATVQRDEALRAEGVLAGAVAEQSRTAVAVAESERAAAALAVRAASGGGSQALSAAAAIAEAEAHLASARAAKSRTVVVAPFDGIVLARHVERGDSVQIGARLFELSGVGETRLVIEPDERSLALLAVKQPAVASAEAYPKQRFEAEVSYIAPAVDPRRGTVEVRLWVPKPPDYLVADMTVSVEVQVGVHEQATVVPTGAVAAVRDDEATVYALRGGRVHHVPVTIGLVSDDVVEIVGGLPKTVELAVPLGGELDDGDAVRVVTP